MSDSNERRWVDLGTELLDHQIVDPDSMSVGKVDDLDLRVQADGRIEVTALVVGTSALLSRIGLAGKFLRWLMSHWGGPDEPRLIPLHQVTGVGSAVHVTAEAASAARSPTEERVRRAIIQRIPGAGHESG
jgi:sporulation protein YlmC with PRC-barrel domain